MVFSFVYALTAVAGLCVASYTDLKERVVPNSLNFGLLVAGFGLHFLESFLLWSWEPLFFSFAGALIAFLFALFFYKIGAWAGGDVKLFAALGSLMPFPLYGFLDAAPVYEFPLFPFMILVNSVIVAFPFIMFYILFKMFSRVDLRTEFKKIVLRITEKALVFTAFFFSVPSLIASVSLPEIVSLPVFLVFSFFPKRVKFVLSGFLFLTGFYLHFDIVLFLGLLGTGLLFAGFFEALTYGRKALRKKVSVSDLEEGMIPAELVFVENGEPKKFSRSFKDKIFLFEPKGVVVSDLSAAGVTEEQINRLKELGVKSLLVKESVPMLPILLLGCITSLIVGDLFWFALNFF